MTELKIMADSGHVAWDMERFQFLGSQDADVDVPMGADRLDVVAQPAGKGLHGASIKTRTFARTSHFVGYNDDGKFDWLAIVVLPAKAASDAASSLFRKRLRRSTLIGPGPEKTAERTPSR
jgi:hypothetical protein